ncbi:MAG: TSUP family transporter, partial [Blastocatellia bacterium]
VDMLTLILLIAASVLGTWLGAGVVAGWSRRNVQIGMGFALLAAATLMLMSQLGIAAAGGTALGLQGPKLLVGVIGNFILGALMSLGIGLYGPCLILISLLGMDPKTAFPIMMGSCAFLMPVGSARFIQKKSFNLRAAIGLALGGIPAVLIAALIVKSLPLSAVRWLVVIVVVYTAVMMLRSAMVEQEAVVKQEA